MFKRKTKDTTPIRDPCVMIDEPYNHITHPLFAQYLGAMKVAEHLEPGETILIGYEAPGGKTEFAFTNFGLIWRLENAKRHQVNRLNYATNPITDVGFREPGRKDRHAGLTFVMGNTGIGINVRQKGQEIPEAIKYFKVLRMLSDEQLRRQQEQAFASQLGALSLAATQPCFKDAIVAMMTSIDMIPPPDEEVGRDGDPVHWDRVYITRVGGVFMPFARVGMSNKRPAW